jgi:hypothetical protein
VAVEVVTEVTINRPVEVVGASAMRRANRKDLARLRSILEAG